MLIKRHSCTVNITSLAAQIVATFYRVPLPLATVPLRLIRSIGLELQRVQLHPSSTSELLRQTGDPDTVDEIPP